MQPASNKIFRKVALVRLSSPEQLDLMTRVIPPIGWIALIPLLGIILMVVLWGWFGSIPTKVSGRCVIINPVGLANITVLSPGRVTEILVRVGDSIKIGQEVARVAQPELADRIEKAESRLRELESQGLIVRGFAERTTELGAQGLVQQRQNLEGQLRAGEERGRILRQRVNTQRQLVDQGLITDQQLLQTRQELVQSELDLENIRGQVEQLALRRLETDKQTQNEVARIVGQINEAQRELDSLLKNRKQMTAVTSPYDGRVVDIKADVGSLVGQASALVGVEKAGAEGQGLQAVIYVPAADSGKVLVKMSAQITPSTVKREEYGYMLGTVTYVSDYPATMQSMMLLLQNEGLVKDLMGSTPPSVILADLIAEKNFSGYRWSSPAGAPVQVRSGTLCNADLVVSKQRPISLAIPILKKTLSLD